VSLFMIYNQKQNNKITSISGQPLLAQNCSLAIKAKKQIGYLVSLLDHHLNNNIWSIQMSL